MASPTLQNPLDWITQYWNILLGKKVDAVTDAWLLGPIGKIGEDSDRFIERIAQEAGLRIERNPSGAGLVESLEDWDVSVSSQIESFYKRTADFQLAVQAVWKPVFGSLGYLVARLYSRRIQQLNLPRSTSDADLALDSELIKLIDAHDVPRFTIWCRHMRETGEAVFCGIYTSCRIPSGEFCVKAIFPLPRGSATVLFRLENDARGNLLLVSSGQKYGDPGFYFLVEDRQGVLWKHYLPSFRETISISENGDGSLQAEHTLKLWSMQVYRMLYHITETRP